MAAEEIGKAEKAALLQMYKLYTTTMSGTVKQASYLTNALESSAQHQLRTSKAGAEFEQQLKDSKFVLLERDKVQIAEMRHIHDTIEGYEAQRAQLKQIAEERGTLNEQEVVALKNANKEIVYFTKVLKDKEAEFKGFNFSKAGKGVVDNIGGFVKGMFLRYFAMFYAIDAAKQIYETVQKEMATGISLGMADYFKMGYKFGLKPQEYVDMVAANREAVLAAGGLAKNFDLLDQGVTRYFKDFGNLADATRYVQEQMTMLTKAGIRPTSETVGLLGGSFEKMRKLAGMTGVDFNAAMNNILDDESAVVLLRSTASEKERMAIVESTANRLAENKAMGMMREQAIAAAKTLNKLAAESPRERLMKGVKLQALMGFLGISGGEQVRQILGKAETERTDKDRAFLAKKFGEISNKAGEAQAGSIRKGLNLVLPELIDKWGLGGLVAATSNMNTNIIKTVAPTDDAAKSLREVSKATANTVLGLQRIEGILMTPGGPFAGLGVAAATAGGAIGDQIAKGMFKEEASPLLSKEKRAQWEKEHSPTYRTKEEQQRVKEIEDMRKERDRHHKEQLAAIKDGNQIAKDAADAALKVDDAKRDAFNIGRGMTRAEEGASYNTGGNLRH